MDEKLARLDEILFNLFFSNELESEKGKKALNRKAKAMEIDEASLRKFIDKRLDKYLQAEDFLKDECTKNPLPENIKDEYFELCVDLEIPKDKAEQLLERKLSTIPRELTAAEKKKAELEQILYGKKHYEIPEVGISFDASLSETAKCFYYYYRVHQRNSLKKLRDSLLAIDSGSKLTAENFSSIALNALQPCINFAKMVYKICNDSEISDEQVLAITEFPQAMYEYGRRAQHTWQEFSIALKQCHETGGNSSMLAIGSLGFMATAYAAKGIGSAIGAIGRGIRNARFDSEQERRFLNKFYDECENRIVRECDDAIVAIYNKFIGNYSEVVYMDLCRKGEMSASEKFSVLHKRFAAGENNEKIKKEYAVFINQNPWLPDAWAELAELYSFGSKESFHILQTGSHLNKGMNYFLLEANRKDFIVCQMNNKTVPDSWHEHIKKMDVSDAVHVCLSFVNLRKAVEQKNSADCEKLVTELWKIAENGEEQEQVNAISMILHISDPKEFRKAMIGHLFYFSPVSDKKYLSIKDEKIQEEFIKMQKFVEKYISQQDLKLFEDGNVAADQLNLLIPVLEMEEKGAWNPALQELDKNVFAKMPIPMLVLHKTACSLMSANDSLVTNLESYSSLSEKARSWLSDYEKKTILEPAWEKTNLFFTSISDFWKSETGKLIEKNIPEKKKKRFVAQISAISAFLSENQKEKISECAVEINDKTFRYAESLRGLYIYISSEEKVCDNLVKFLTDFPDIEEKELSLLLGTQNQKQIADVIATCRTIQKDLDEFDKKLLSGIMHHQAQDFAARYGIFTQYLDLRSSEIRSDWKKAVEISKSLMKVNKYGLYFEIANLYFNIMTESKHGTTCLLSYIEGGTTLAGLQKYWPHGKWDTIFTETYQSIIAKHKEAVKNSGIIELAERIFNYSFSREYSVCHADDIRISKTILPSINSALKKSCGSELKPQDILAAFRSTQSDGVITPWGMIACYKTTHAVKHTYWINAVKADRCWGATLKIVMKDGTGDETSLETFSYYPIDDLVKLCDYMISFWSDISDDQVEEILNGKFYENPANWISLFSGERTKINILEIAEFEDGEINKISRETSERTQENHKKNENSLKNTSTNSATERKTEKANSSGSSQKITKTAASAYFANINDPKIMVFPDIPREKMEAAVKGFGIGINPADIIVLADNTISGSADEGLIITLDAMYSKSQFDDAKEIFFDKCKTLNIEYKKRFLLGYAIEINGNSFASLQIPKAIPELLNGVTSYITELRNPKPQRNAKSNKKENNVSESEQKGRESGKDLLHEKKQTQAKPSRKSKASSIPDSAPKKEKNIPDSSTNNSTESTFSLEIVSAESSRINVIMAIRSITSMGLAEAKNFTNNLPQILLHGISRDEAIKNKEILEQAGATVSIKPLIEEKLISAENRTGKHFKCSQCGKEYPGGTKFCSECGGKIEEILPAIEMEDAIEFRCSQCGKEYPEGTKFCSECGGKIESRTVSVPKRKSQSKVQENITTPSADSMEEKASTDNASHDFMVLFSNIKDDHIFSAPDIPAKKLNNAMGSYAPGIGADDVIALVDDTLWGGAREGMIITKKKLFGKELMESPVAIKLSPKTKISIVKDKEFHVDGKKLCSFTMPDKESLKELAAAILEMCKS